MTRAIKRTIWISILVLVVIIIGGAIFASTRPQPPEIFTATVNRQVLTQTVEATGEVRSIDEVELSSDISGTISEVLVLLGEEVTEGQVLARLESEELNARVDNAREAVQSAQAKVNERLAGSTTEMIEVAQASVSVAEASLEQARIDLQNRQSDLTQTIATSDSSISEANIAVQTAKDDLANVESDTDQDLLELDQDLVSILRSVMISVRSGLSEADEVLGIDNSLANDAFQDILSALDAQKLISAENAYDLAKDSRDDAENAVFVLSFTSSATEIDAAESLVEVALSDAMDTLLFTRQTLDATNADDEDFTSADLSALEASIDAARDDVQASQDQLLTHQQLISSTEIATQTALTNAQNALTSAEQALSSANISKGSSVSAAESAVRAAESLIVVRESSLLEAQARLSEVLAGPRNVDIASLQADVRRAQADLDAAEARLEQSEIISPIMGRVSRIELEVGEQVFETEPVVTVQTIDDAFEIVADIAESDIAKVSLQDAAEFTFDAFGDDTVINGFVSEIEPAEKEIEGVVFYEVDLTLDPGMRLSGLKPGMSSDIEIRTEEKSSVLVIPQRAVLERPGGSKYVRMKGGDLFVEQDVTVGLRGDGGLVEVLSGLDEGEEIILTIREQN